MERNTHNLWNSIKRISHMIIPGERKSGSIRKLRIDTDLFKKTCIKTPQGMKELRKICCTEAERSQQMNFPEKRKSINSESAYS